MGNFCSEPTTLERPKTKQTKVKFFDAHFHLFDGLDEDSPHVKAHKDEPADPNHKKTFLTKEYEELITGNDPVELLGGTFIEMVCPPEWKIEEA